MSLVEFTKIAGVSKYDPSQPRDPKGSPTGGQWSDSGASSRFTTVDELKSLAGWNSKLLEEDGLPASEEMGINFSNVPSYREMSDEETEVAGLVFEESRALETQRRRAITVAIARGEIEPDAAKERWGRRAEVDSAEWEDLPDNLYHATTNLTSILDEGIKTRGEIGRTAGLGGGPEDTISFTGDFKIAERIAQVLTEAHEFVSGQRTTKSYIETAEKNGFLEQFRESLRSVNGIKLDRDVEITDVKQRFEFFRSFTATWSWNGGPMDPLFFNVDAKKIAELDPNEIAILTYEPVPKAKGWQVNALGEWRIPTADGVVTQIAHDYYTPPLEKLNPGPYYRDEGGRFTYASMSGRNSTGMLNSTDFMSGHTTYTFASGIKVSGLDKVGSIQTRTSFNGESEEKYFSVSQEFKEEWDRVFPNNWGIDGGIDDQDLDMEKIALTRSAALQTYLDLGKAFPETAKSLNRLTFGLDISAIGAVGFVKIAPQLSLDGNAYGDDTQINIDDELIVDRLRELTKARTSEADALVSIASSAATHEWAHLLSATAHRNQLLAHKEERTNQNDWDFESPTLNNGLRISTGAPLTGYGNNETEIYVDRGRAFFNPYLARSSNDFFNVPARRTAVSQYAKTETSEMVAEAFTLRRLNGLPDNINPEFLSYIDDLVRWAEEGKSKNDIGFYTEKQVERTALFDPLNELKKKKVEDETVIVTDGIEMILDGVSGKISAKGTSSNTQRVLNKIRKYRNSQKRAPKGSPIGGQWVDEDDLSLGRTAELSFSPNGSDSVSKHLISGTRRFTKEREALHDEIVKEILSTGVKSENPVFTMLGGGTASGKSSVTKTGLSSLPENAVHIDSDAIKKMLPEAKEMLSANDNNWAAFTHEESSYLAKRVMNASLYNSYNTVLDGTGDGSPTSALAKIKAAKDAGFKVEGIYVTIPTEVAIAREASRAAVSGRSVPRRIIEGTHRGVSVTLPAIISEFDSVSLWSNDVPEGAKPVLVVKGTDGALDVRDPEIWESFKKKADV